MNGVSSGEECSLAPHCDSENVQEQQCVPGNRANVAETRSGLLFSVDLGTMDGGICSGFYQATTRTGHRHGPGTQGYVAELDSEPPPIGAYL